MINLAGPPLQPTAFPLNCNSSATFPQSPHPTNPPKKSSILQLQCGNEAGVDLACVACVQKGRGRGRELAYRA